MGNRYYVRREECWGGTYVYSVADRERSFGYQAAVIGKRFDTELKAQRRCDRANFDWQRFLDGGRIKTAASR